MQGNGNLTNVFQWPNSSFNEIKYPSVNFIDIKVRLFGRIAPNGRNAPSQGFRLERYLLLAG